MTAGSPSVRGTDMLTLTRQQTDRIARLFAEGQLAGHIALIARYTRARVLQGMCLKHYMQQKRAA